MKNETLYLITHDDINNSVIGTNLTTEQAAIELLTYDGYGYEIELKDGFWTLYVSSGSRNSTLGLGAYRESIFSTEDEEEKARAEIFEEVISEAGSWYPDLNVEEI
jgi:topoisomerase IA-like protein